MRFYDSKLPGISRYFDFCRYDIPVLLISSGVQTLPNQHFLLHMEVTAAMKSKSRCTLFLLGLLLTSGAFAQGSFYLKDGDRVVFYGDSITEQRLYTTFTETFVVTRFPDRKIEFIHSGWSGDRVTGGGGGSIEIRLNRDLIAFRPTVVTIMLGMNDGRYRAFDQELFNTFSGGYEKMVGMIKAALPNVRMTMIQPSPYDDVTRAPGFEGGYNAVLVRYSQFIKELAQRSGFDVADLNTQVVAALVKAKAADEANAQKIVPDRIHPGAPGCLLMAGELLKAWNAPAVVSTVEEEPALPPSMASLRVCQLIELAALIRLARPAWQCSQNAPPARSMIRST